MTKSSDQGDVETVSRKKTRSIHPPQFKVLLLNDDFTTMDFVVAVLEEVFQKSPAEAVAIMLQIHKQGRAVAGIYAKQIAEAKIEMVHQRAQAQGHPLRSVLEEI